VDDDALVGDHDGRVAVVPSCPATVARAGAPEIHVDGLPADPLGLEALLVLLVERPGRALTADRDDGCRSRDGGGRVRYGVTGPRARVKVDAFRRPGAASIAWARPGGISP
jgi:hypothetical protein